MRTFAVSLSRKFISILFAAILILGLVPVAAFAVDDVDAGTAESGQTVDVSSVLSSVGAEFVPVDGEEGNRDGVHESSGLGDDTVPSEGNATTEGIVTDSEDVNAVAVPAADVINQTIPLEVVAQQESARSYFLAQTLESTKTVPIVSASLPLDKGMNQGPQAGADGGTTVGSEDEVTDGDPSVSTEGDGSSEDEGGDDSDESDESDLGVSDDASAMAPGVSGESTVVGSFTYLGMTFAVEPGGESVALVTVDYSKLPEEFVQKQILAVPDAATPDGIDHYSVTRIAANAFSSLTEENANPDHTGCIELFSDEELLAEAGIDPADVAGFLPQDDAAAATEDGQDADASSDDIRTIVSMDGNVATLDDGSTYGFANPLEGCAGILALGIPASVSSIEDDAFAGADTLQYLVVSEDNPEYASFDGALYSADTTNLRLIPEGRVGAVRVAPSATSADPEVFSHCPSVDALVADAESEAYSVLMESGYRDMNGSLIRFLTYSAQNGVVFEGIDGNLSDLLKCMALISSEGGSLVEIFNEMEHAGADGTSVTQHIIKNVRIYYPGTVNVHWNREFVSFPATNGATYQIKADTTAADVDVASSLESGFSGAVRKGYITIRAATYVGVPGASSCYIDSTSYDHLSMPAAGDGGIRSFFTQNPTNYLNKTVTRYDRDPVSLVLPATSVTKIWLNDYRKDMWLSEEYLPAGGSWKTVDNNATANTDSKYYEHANKTYDGTTTTTVTVRAAPETAPLGKPVFVGWKCAQDGKTYKPGQVIWNVKEPLVFEAQWSTGFILKWDANTADTTVARMPEDKTIPVTLSSGVPVSTQGMKSLYATTAALPATPIRADRAFAGWYIDAACKQRVTDAVLAQKIVGSAYAGSDAASCIRADAGGAVTLYAGWANVYNNLTLFSNKTVYASWNDLTIPVDATMGIPYRIIGDSLDYTSHVISQIVFSPPWTGKNTFLAYARATSGADGASIAYLNENYDRGVSGSDGGVTKIHMQDSNAKLNKTVRSCGVANTVIQLNADSAAKVWLNDYKYGMWLSEEYLPNGATWRTVDNNAISADDSKYYEHNGKTYDGSTTTTVTVRPAPENAPSGKPVFIGWKCKQDNKIYHPGAVIQNVKEPLIFEAQWESSFTLKWDKNAGADSVSGMPADQAIAATYAGGFAVTFQGMKSVYPTVASLPTTPTRVGWVFSGWYMDASCTKRVTDAVLEKPIVSSTYVGTDVSNCIQAAIDGSVTLYAGWANAYDNLTVYSEKTLYTFWNQLSISVNATTGKPYCIIGDTLDTTNHIIAEVEPFPVGRPAGAIAVRALAKGGVIGTSLATVDPSYDHRNPAANGGITKVHFQDSHAKLNKTVRIYTASTDAIPLDPNSEAKLWVNDYRYNMWLSEEYLPCDGTWASVDNNAISIDDSKYYEHVNKTYDGITTTTVTVKAAPEKAPFATPVFVGWKCRQDGKTYMPGAVIQNVSEPLVFEAQWSSAFVLKWDENAEAGSVASMPEVGAISAVVSDDAAVSVQGLKSIYPSVSSLPATPIRAGWVFAGWYTDKACTNRVTDDVLGMKVVSSSYTGSDASDCIRAASDGSVTLYAGWANPYTNLTVFFDKPVYVRWNSLVTSIADATEGAPYRILGDTIDDDIHILEDITGLAGGGYNAGCISVRAAISDGGFGSSLCYVSSDFVPGASNANGGIASMHFQDSRKRCDKTVRRYEPEAFTLALPSDGSAKLWLNDYRKNMWLSEEYLPNGGAWKTANAWAQDVEDSKYYEHEGETYDGTSSITVLVRPAPENAPDDRPVFLGWRCEQTGRIYQPGAIINNVSEPLVFEAVWTDIYNVAVPLLVGVALDPATGEARASEGASLSTTNPSQVEVVSLEYDLVEEIDDLDGKGEVSVPGGGTHRVFSDEEGASHLDEVSLTVLAGEAAGGGSAGAVPLEVPLSAPCRLDDADALAAAGFVPFGAAAGDLAIEYGLSFSLEGDALTDMLGRLGLPEKDGLDGASSESFPIAKLFYTIAMVERGD